MEPIFQVLQDLCLINPPSRAVLFIRHAERHPILRAGEGQDVSLTDNGIQRAQELGRRLPKNYLLSLSNTGVKRTVQTCESIAQGFSQTGGVVQGIEEVKAICGSYVVNAQKLFEVANTLGDKFVSHWLQGKLSPSLIEDPEVAARDLLRRVMDTESSNCRLPEENELHIHVAHDWDIYVLRYVLLGIEPEQHPVDYLGGIIFTIQDGGLEARSLGKSQKLSERWTPWRK